MTFQCEKHFLFISALGAGSAQSDVGHSRPFLSQQYTASATCHLTPGWDMSGVTWSVTHQQRGGAWWMHLH